MSLGEGSQVLKITGNSSVYQTLDWGQELVEQVTVVSAISGRPMVGWTVTWRNPDLGVVTSVTDYYGVARVRFIPTTSGPAELTATVGEGIYAQVLSFPFEMSQPREISALIIAQPGTYPGDEVEAQATIISTVSGLPLDNIEVMWEFDGVWLTPTPTDVDGNATVRFRLEASGSKVLTASVRGGEGGWDAAQLLFTVLEDEWVIEELTSTKPIIYQGEQVNAVAKVVTRRHGVAVEKAVVSWSFPSLELSPSNSDAQGFASVEFSPTQLGEYDLTASVSGVTPSSKTMAVKVLDPVTPDHATIQSFVASKNPCSPWEYVTVTASIISTLSKEPMPNREVFMSFDGGAYFPTKTDGAGKVSHTARLATSGSLRWDIKVQNLGGTSQHRQVVVIYK
ncbi:hypothetical protein [Pseudomonas sp. LB3P38]|uniref:hypothetical protein n=1 Tax=Pseudomonas lyxosi TaxID=3398358 RepID=UPI0039F10A84